MKGKGPENGVILAACIGDCVHVAGVMAFLDIARSHGFETTFMGPAVPVSSLLEEAGRLKPDIIAISYRLDPSALGNLLSEFKEGISKARIEGTRLLFGGTPATSEIAKKSGIFSHIFTGGESPDEVRVILLQEQAQPEANKAHAKNLIERIEGKKPFPLLRHHFGLPTVEETVKGAREIAMAGVLDVLSLGPDQNAQEHFFHPEDMDPAQNGAGGVPVRTREDFIRIYEASRCGNHPLVRCYSGTRDIIKMAAVLKETIHNAWCAVPLFWYNVLDGRSTRPLKDAISENQQVMKWHADRGIPVEVNEAHHWSLRNAPDAVAVATAFLAAYNAKKMGVKHYVAQYMLNTPPATYARMDLAKMLAKIELIEALHDDDFISYRQVRGGLASMSSEKDFAKGQLAASTFLGMLLRPHIVHVVGFSEAYDVARPKEVIESVQIAAGTIHNILNGSIDIQNDPIIMERKEFLLKEAGVILDAIYTIGKGSPDPWSDPETLASAVKLGILDAPHLVGNPAACGKITTRIIDGACWSCDPHTGEPVTEGQRIRALGL